MLRRALLLVCLLAPLAASAQSVTFPDAGPFTVARCNADPATSVTWTVTTTDAILAGYKYRILVLRGTDTCSGLTNPADTTADSQVIIKDLPAQVGTVGATPSATYPGYNNTSADLRLSDLLSAGKQTCDGTANLTLTVCVQLTKADGTYVTSATGTLAVEREKPAQPLTVVVTPGDSALLVSWAAGSGSTTVTSRYRAEAYACVDAADTTCSNTVASSAETGNDTSRSLRIGGLAIGTKYKVLVYSLSGNGTPSLPSDPQYGTPINALDYWELYQQMHQGLDAEQGGCGGGPAGLTSLLAVAGALALRRRRS